MRPVYLDYNATTPIAPAVVEAMLPFLTEHHGNPSSAHEPGRICQGAVEEARERVASLLGCDAGEVVFTSGGSESNNLALKGILQRGPRRAGGRLLISAFEHPAVQKPAEFLQNRGIEVDRVPVGRNGLIDPEAVRARLTADTRLVSIMHANNEIGTLQPIAEIAEICRSRGIVLHTDAAQSVGKVPVRVGELGVDMLTVAGHKLYAPKGVGALYVRGRLDLEPLIHGAGHEGGRRAGTENVPYLVGLGRAAELCQRVLEESMPRVGRLRDRLLAILREGVGPSLTVNGDGAPRLPNTLSVIFPGISSAELLERAPQIHASTGAACHGDSISPSSTLQAIGLDAERARGALRLSLGVPTTEEEIDRSAEVLLRAYRELRRE
jgi:cysteine desulfurase